MSHTPSKIQQIIDEGYNFDFSEYISRGFSLMGRNPGGFIGFLIVSSLIGLVIGAVPIVGFLIGLVVNPALAIGYYVVADKLDRDEPTEFGDFFQGFSRVLPLFLTSLLTILVMLAAMLPGGLVFYFSYTSSLESGEMGTPMMFGAILLVIVPIAYLGVSYIFAPLLVWFYNMEPWAAMEASRKIVSRQWWAIFGFLIVVGLIAAAGMLALVVGLLYTVPAMTLALYAAFADITRLHEEESDEPDVIDHFVPMGG